VLVKLDADPDRLRAAAVACRLRYQEQIAAGGDPRSDRTGGFARGAHLADVAVEMVREAGADTSAAARQRLLGRAQRDTFGDPDAGPGLAERLRVAADSWRWPRKARRLSPAWRRRRAILAVVQIHTDVADTPDEVSIL
jgi:hypothetical protein